MLHKQPVHVVYTDYRPTPLQHFIFPVGGEGLYEVVNIQVRLFLNLLCTVDLLTCLSTIDLHWQGQFREDKFTQAMSGLAAVGDKAAGGVKQGRKGGAKGRQDFVIFHPNRIYPILLSGEYSSLLVIHPRLARSVAMLN